MRKKSLKNQVMVSVPHDVLIMEIFSASNDIIHKGFKGEGVLLKKERKY
jgi:hypothetical protein